ncbi:MAG: GNAT family N-acetyltransferase [Acidimicrobiales bacterium]
MDQLPIDVGPVEPSRTLELRQRVLRPHQSLEEMSLPGAGHPDAGIIGATDRETGEVVGTASVTPEAPPDGLARVLPGGARWRLRSMATSEPLRGAGVGSAVLAAALGHVADRGGGVVWCNARVRARAFYERAGFVAFGETWLEPDIGPHVMMWRVVERPPTDEKESAL